MEHVNHPKHYNSHPNGIECIDIIRHYTCDIANAIKYLWRAGLKPEMGMEDAEKEIEDLKKALWYIEDYKAQHYKKAISAVLLRKTVFEKAFKELTGHTIKDVCNGYLSPVKEAMEDLLRTGLIYNGSITCSPVFYATRTIDAILQRIADLEH